MPVAAVLAQQGGRLPEPGQDRGPAVRRPAVRGPAVGQRQRGVGRGQHPAGEIQFADGLPEQVGGHLRLGLPSGQQAPQPRLGPGQPGPQRIFRRDQVPDRRDRAGDEGGSEVEERGRHHRGPGRPERRGPPGEVAAPEPAQARFLEGCAGFGREINHRVDGLEQGPHRTSRMRRVRHDRSFPGVRLAG